MSEREKKEEPIEPPPTEEQGTQSTEEAPAEVETVAETETEEATEPEEEVEEKPSEPEEETTEAGEGEEGEDEIEVVEERIYTIPLRHAWVVTPRGMRAPRTARDVRNFVARHMKADEVSISNDVNSLLWARGINKPPRKIKIRAVKDKEGKVIIYPAKAA